MADADVLQAWVGLVSDPSTAVVGLGNPDRGDDGIGIAIAAYIKARWHERVFFEGGRRAEDTVLDLLESEAVRTVLFIDAVDFGGKPGDVRLFAGDRARQILPPISTHTVPLALLMELIRGRGKRSFLLGIQPGSMNPSLGLSSAVRHALDGLAKALNRYCYSDHKKCGGGRNERPGGSDLLYKGSI